MTCGAAVAEHWLAVATRQRDRADAQERRARRLLEVLERIGYGDKGPVSAASMAREAVEADRQGG